jgi:hypothetical protein
VTVGDYITYRTKEGVRAGLVVGPEMVFAFDGSKEGIPEGVKKISKEAAYDLLQKYALQIAKSWKVKFEPKE